MHIIQVITELEPAGAERILCDLSLKLKEKGHNVSVLIIKRFPKNRFILDKLISANIPVYSLGIRKLSFFKILKIKSVLAKIISSFKNQDVVVHSHLMHANLICRLGKLLGGKYKLLNTIHILEIRKSKKWLLFLDKLSLNFVDFYSAVSNSAQRFHSQLLKIDTSRINVVENGISIPDRYDERMLNRIKKDLKISGFTKIIGSVGRLNNQKGYDLLLGTLEEISEKIPKNEKWAIVILGEGNERKKLESLLINAPLNLKVFLPGYRSDAANCIELFDVFVISSRFEGLPLVLLEAMSFGIPILTSLAEPMPEILRGYPNYKCINFKDKIVVSNSIIEQIYLNKDKNYILPYTLEKMVDGYIELYTRIV